jgi:hypothetical protein
MFVSFSVCGYFGCLKNLNQLSGSGSTGRSTFDGFAKNRKMAMQKFRPARPGVFSGAKAYISYVEVLKKRRNAAGRIFCDAISFCASR